MTLPAHHEPDDHQDADYRTYGDGCSPPIRPDGRRRSDCGGWSPTRHELRNIPALRNVEQDRLGLPLALEVLMKLGPEFVGQGTYPGIHRGVEPWGTPECLHADLVLAKFIPAPGDRPLDNEKEEFPQPRSPVESLALRDSSGQQRAVAGRQIKPALAEIGRAHV